MRIKERVSVPDLSGMRPLPAKGTAQEKTLIPHRSTITIKGGTSHPAILLFVCDDGNTHEINSRSSGGSAFRFRLILPSGVGCRLWIKRRGSTFRHITFSDPQGNRSPLITPKSSAIDLGTIRIGQNDPMVVEVGDDLAHRLG